VSISRHTALRRRKTARCRGGTRCIIATRTRAGHARPGGGSTSAASYVQYICTVNHLMGTLKPESNGPLYSNTVIGTLAVDGWAVTFGTARRGLGGLRPRPVSSSLYQM